MKKSAFLVVSILLVFSVLFVLGTAAFAEAVRIFAQQSIREGGMPFTPSLKSWDELTQDEIDARLRKSMADVSAGRVLSQDQLDAKMRERFARG